MTSFKRKNVFKLLAVTVLVSFMALAGGVMFLSKSTATVQGFSLKTDRLVYRSDEHPDFSLKAKIIRYSNFWDRLKNKVLAEAVPQTQVLYNNQPINMPVDVTSDGNGGYNVSLVPQNSIQPGKYALEVTIDTPQGPQTQQQNFAWGVLAVNTDKATYLPGETAKIQMAVLSSSGHTICNAPLSLTVTAPDGSQSQPAVEVSGHCDGDNYVTDPDYTAAFTVSGAGTYKMLLRLGDSDYALSDTFEAQVSVPFDITRAGPTRIYPPADYPMAFTVHANQDFTGVVVDTLPKDFTITDNGGAKVTQDGDHQTLSWQAGWKAGQDYSLSYHFKAPPTSPAFYFVGPLEFSDDSGVSVYKETRRWQIAGDTAFPSTTILDDFNRTNAGTLGANWTLDTGDNNLQIVSNQAAGTNAAGNMDYWNTTQYGSDSEAFVTISTLAGVGKDVLVADRMTNPGPSSSEYRAIYTQGTGLLLYKRVSGTFTQLGSTLALTLSAGDKIGLSSTDTLIIAWYKQGAGPWINGVQATDSSVTGSGFIGLEMDGTAGRLDDFGGGTGFCSSSPTTEQVMRGGTWFCDGAKQDFFWAS